MFFFFRLMALEAMAITLIKKNTATTQYGRNFDKTIKQPKQLHKSIDDTRTHQITNFSYIISVSIH